MLVDFIVIIVSLMASAYEQFPFFCLDTDMCTLVLVFMRCHLKSVSNSYLFLHRFLIVY